MSDCLCWLLTRLPSRSTTARAFFRAPAIPTSRRTAITCARSGGFPISMSATGSSPATPTTCRSARLPVGSKAGRPSAFSDRQDSYNLRGERGLSNFDVRHRFVASYAYDLPFGKASRWLKGWQTFGILQFQTGQPFTVSLLPDFDNSNTGIDSLGFGANDRPNVVGSPRLSNPTANEWFNTSAFAIPPYGTFGNSGRNTLEGPGMATVDLSLVKNTAIRERATVQFRVEAFNVLNRTNFGLPDNFIGSPTFGQILSAGNPRRLQLGLKLLF